MMLWTRRSVYLVCGVVLIGLVGCADPRTSNQGGGSLLTVADKMSRSDLMGMNPDEWQILFDNAPTYAPQFGWNLPAGMEWPVLSDEEAQAITDFIDANNITSLQKLQQVIMTGGVPPSLMGLAGGT